MAIQYTLSQQAKQEFKNTLSWSEARFGASATIRYKHLLKTAFETITADPESLHSQSVSDFRIYHLRHCRRQAALDTKIVKTPRHFLIYRMQNNTLEISRILHDKMNIEDQIRDSD